MIKIARVVSRFGYIDISTNENRSILYAKPSGYVGPDLVKKDLEFLKKFDAHCEGGWKYIVDTSAVKIANPINPFLLNSLKQFSKMNEYVVYAPSPIVRLMLKLTSWINKPDRIIKENKALQIELKN